MKHKTLLRVLVAITLVSVMAVLPILTSLWQDRATLGKPSVGKIQNVELNFEHGIPGLGLLALMYQEKQWEPVNEVAASMTREEAKQAALDAILPYQEADLIDREISFELYLVEASVLSSTSGQASIVWSATVVARREGQTVGEIQLTLEDATGRVMSMVYATESLIPEADRVEILDAFTGLFFTQLGIEDYSQAAADDLDNTYIGDDGAVAQRYRFRDTVYGEVVVNLFVHQYGFYTTFFDF